LAYVNPFSAVTEANNVASPLPLK